jgi:hypothetical protein
MLNPTDSDPFLLHQSQPRNNIHQKKVEIKINVERDLPTYNRRVALPIPRVALPIPRVCEAPSI